MFFGNSVFRNNQYERQLEKDFLRAAYKYIASPYVSNSFGQAMYLAEELHNALSWLAWQHGQANQDAGNVFVHRGFAVAVNFNVERKQLCAEVLNANRTEIVRFATTYEELRSSMEQAINEFISIYDGPEADLLDKEWQQIVAEEFYEDPFMAVFKKPSGKQPLSQVVEWTGYEASLHYHDTPNTPYKLTGMVQGMRDDIYLNLGACLV